MKKTLKMTDVSKSEVEEILRSVRYIGTLGCEVIESDMEVVLNCEVNDSNKFVFAAVFKELFPFVYSDEDETPFDRFCGLVEVRKLNVGIIDQGFRGKLVEKLFSQKCRIKNFVGFEQCDELMKFFDSDDLKTIAEKYARAMKLDVVIVGTAEIEGDGLISSLSKIAIFGNGKTREKSYYLLGTADDIANKLSFLSVAMADKEIY